MFIRLSFTQNKLLVNVFVVTSSGDKLEPSSGYNTRIEKRETRTGTEKREPLEFLFFLSLCSGLMMA
jgi:hypothetical protein